ncbi:PfkB family carbohydrate kinase [Streptomyces sp. NPDC048057]|uniref:carbohydrate kinase family protein n=1 Tax=Streptomyces sp. NPDC048057 TaxID=3155628 RepID=UPI0033CD1447
MTHGHEHDAGHEGEHKRAGDGRTKAKPQTRHENQHENSSESGHEGPPPPSEPAALLVIGEVATDVIARHSAPLEHGTDTAARIRIIPGGAAANVACWAARKSPVHEVRLFGRVGQAEEQWHCAHLRATGVRPVLVVDDNASTTTVVSLVDATAERTFLTDSGALQRFGPTDWSPTLLDGVGHVHLSGYLLFSDSSRQLARLARESARARGITVSMDPASAGFIRQRGVAEVLAELDSVHLLVPNADEARLLAGLPDVAASAAALSRRVPLVVVTLGEGGALVATAGAVTARVPARAVEALDSTGAGDAFTGGFLAAWLSGADTVTAASAGCRAGTEAVTLPGGRPPLSPDTRPTDTVSSGIGPTSAASSETGPTSTVPSGTTPSDAVCPITACSDTAQSMPPHAG